jgi:serine/threonine protein kinase
MSAKSTIDDYEPIKLLGQGAFAEVYLMRDKQDNCLYAIKKVSKSLLKRENKIEQAIRERELLSTLNHQGIVKLYKAFTSPSYLYLVMEYCSKESLSLLLQRHGRMFPLSVAKHYAAELVEILSVLRHSNIIHRDIKPENILLTPSNHLKLIDFNCAKKLSSRKTIRNTFVGTISYVAPEVVKDEKVIGPEVDLWSLGCLIYQMVTGRLPFAGDSQEIIYENIINGRYCFSSEVHREAVDLISGLLRVEPETRLGANSIDEIKAHNFFQGVDFSTLWNTTVPDVIEAIRKEEERKMDGETEDGKQEVKIIMEGIVHLKKNFFITQTRKLVVTDKPSIKFYSVKTMEEKGSVDVKEISLIKVTKNNWCLIETERKSFEFVSEKPDDWVGAISHIIK